MSRKRTRKNCRRSKRAAQFEHARKRAMTRYGLRLTRAVHDHFIKNIHVNGSTLVERQSHRISIHDVKLNDVTYRVVYDSTRKVLVTFLYKEDDEWPIKRSMVTKQPQPSPTSKPGCDPA